MSEDNSNEKKESKFIGPIIISFVIALIIYFLIFPMITGIFSFIDRTYVSVVGNVTTATVESYEVIAQPEKGGNINYSYIPNLEFSVNGQKVLSKSSFNEVSEMVIPIGSSVSIKYDSSNPTKCVITDSNFNDNAIYKYLYVIIFISFYIVTGIIEKKSRKYKNTNQTDGLLKLCITLGVFLSLMIGFIIWEFVAGQFNSANSLIATIIFLIFSIIDFKLLLSLIKIYTKNSSVKK